MLSETETRKMASLCISNINSITSHSLPLPLSPLITSAPLRPLHQLPVPPAARLSQSQHRITTTRGLTVVTRAGPTTGSYVFAVVFPLSLLAVTIFTSIKIDDKLNTDFLEDLTINQAIREADEEDGGGGDDDDVSLEEIVQEPVLPRTRNRPKREI